MIRGDEVKEVEGERESGDAGALKERAEASCHALHVFCLSGLITIIRGSIEEVSAFIQADH